MSTGVLYGGPDAIINGGGIPTTAVTARITAAMSVVPPSVSIDAAVSVSAAVTAAGVVELAGQIDAQAAVAVAAGVTAAVEMSAREVTAAVTGTVSITAAAQKYATDVYYDQVMLDNPATYLRLGEASGTTFTDASGNGRVGTSTGTPTLGTAGGITDDADTAVTFDGTDDVVTLSAATAFWPTASQGISVECWYRGTFAGGTPALGVMVAGLIAANTGSSNKRWIVGITSAGKVYAQTDDQYVVTGPGTVTVNDNAWHHIVMTVASSTYDVVVYVDGASDASSTSPNDPGSGSPTVTVGRNPRGAVGASYSSGTIDEVAVYSTALSAARVLAHYNAAGNKWSPAVVSVSASVTVAAVVV